MMPTNFNLDLEGEILDEYDFMGGDRVSKRFQDLAILLKFAVLPGEVVIKLGDRNLFYIQTISHKKNVPNKFSSIA